MHFPTLLPVLATLVSLSHSALAVPTDKTNLASRSNDAANQIRLFFGPGIIVDTLNPSKGNITGPAFWPVDALDTGSTRREFGVHVKIGSKSTATKCYFTLAGNATKDVADRAFVLNAVKIDEAKHLYPLPIYRSGDTALSCDNLEATFGKVAPAS